MKRLFFCGGIIDSTLDQLYIAADLKKQAYKLCQDRRRIQV
jgi:hypothetical protein